MAVILMNNFPFMPQFNQDPKQMLAELERMTNEMMNSLRTLMKNACILNYLMCYFVV
jgi:hypothetical protein